MSGVTGNSSVYRQAWARFEDWCSLADRSAMPCSSETLAAYTEHLIQERRLSPSSLRVHVAAIRARHSDRDRPSAAEAGRLIANWKTQRLSAGERQRTAVMLTERQLSAVLATCSPGGLRDKRDAAILTLALGAAVQAQDMENLRLEEVELSDYGVSIRPSTGSPGFASRTPHPLLDPVAAMRSWLACLMIVGSGEGWAFPLVDARGVIQLDSPSTRHTFRQILQRRGAEAGLNTRGLTFRSLRASFIAGRGDASFSESVLAEQSGWLPPLPTLRYGSEPSPWAPASGRQDA